MLAKTVLVPLLAPIAALLVGGCGGTCPAPAGKLHVTVTSNECTACARLAILADSPQIRAAIAAGHSPCAEELADGPGGCVMGSVYVATYGDCGGSNCGPYDVDLSSEFEPAISGVAPSISDTVSFCPFDKSGTTFTAAGNCVSSLSNQCSGTLALFVDGTQPTGGSDGGTTSGSDGSTTGGSDFATTGNGPDFATQCKPNGSPCTSSTSGSCCSLVCSCATGQCATDPVICG